MQKHFQAVHEGKKDYKCVICTYSSVSKRDLTRHIEAVHDRKKTYKCDICNAIFFWEGVLKSHIQMVHEGKGKKTYECNICDYIGPFSDLRRHIISIHGPENYFKCNICDLPCGSKSKLKTHMAVHDGKKPFKCTICEKSFTQKGCLNFHIKKTHEAKKTIKCNENVVPKVPAKHRNFVTQTEKTKDKSNATPNTPRISFFRSKNLFSKKKKPVKYLKKGPLCQENDQKYNSMQPGFLPQPTLTENERVLPNAFPMSRRPKVS